MLPQLTDEEEAQYAFQSTYWGLNRKVALARMGMVAVAERLGRDPTAADQFYRQCRDHLSAWKQAFQASGSEQSASLFSAIQATEKRYDAAEKRFDEMIDEVIGELQAIGLGLPGLNDPQLAEDELRSLVEEMDRGIAQVSASLIEALAMPAQATSDRKASATLH